MLRKIFISALFIVLTTGFGQVERVSITEARLVPKMLNYQGYLTDTLGIPIIDTLNMTFSIFDALTSGNQLWTETQTNVPVDRGIFNVVLGSVNAIPDSVFTHGINRWLELTVVAQTLTPRTRITAMGYAYTATYSDTAEYARNAVADNDWVISGNNMYSAVPGSVGVGVISPAEKLDVDGAVNVSSVYKIGGDRVLSNAGTNNIFVGVGAGENTIGEIGHSNTFVGWHAGYSNTTGHENTFTGGQAGRSNTTGRWNTFSGLYTGRSNTTGNFNTFSGGQAGDHNTTGSYNAFLGNVAGYYNTTGSYNTFSGVEAGCWNAGSYNTFSGYAAGDKNTAGSYNVFIGNRAGYYNTTDSNRLYIANDSSDANVLIYGEFDNRRVGIGTTSPTEALEVNGDCKADTFFGDGSQLTGIAGDNDWLFRITDGADTTLQMGGRWGIVRLGNTMYGNADSTHVNLGVGSITGSSGQNSGYCTVGGGKYNTAAGFYATVGGGEDNTVSGHYATVGGGEDNTASDDFAIVGGGEDNTASGLYATVGGGYSDIASGRNSVVAGGSENTASGDVATVGGGVLNTATTWYATVGGGLRNTVSGSSATVGGGRNNTASGNNATVAGGDNNFVAGDYSAILGGYADTIATTADYSYLFGINSNLTEDSTFMVDMPHILFGDEANGYEFPTSDGTNGQVMATDGSGQLSWSDAPADNDWTISGNNMYSAVPGSVGVGTTTPGAKLDVAGTLDVSGFSDLVGGVGVGTTYRSCDFNPMTVAMSGSRLVLLNGPLVGTGNVPVTLTGTFPGQVIIVRMEEPTIGAEIRVGAYTTTVVVPMASTRLIFIVDADNVQPLTPETPN